MSLYDGLKTALCSVVPVPITPFDSDGRVDYVKYERLLNRLVAGGVTVLTANGNTSEFYSLSPNERNTLLQKTVEWIGDRVTIVSGIGFDVETAIAMGNFARSVGAQGVMVHQPIHPYQSARGWVRYHAEIARALPELGLVLYLRDPSITADMLETLVTECSNVIGVKFSVPNPNQFTHIAARVGVERLAWVCGLTEIMAPFFWLGGARGFTSGLANVHPPLAFQMLDSLRAGDGARTMQLWGEVKPFEDMRARHNAASNVPVIKEALAQLGVCGRTVRPPISELAENERAEVRQILERWGLLPKGESVR